jgi:toxin secretion/phage lysis holin
MSTLLASLHSVWYHVDHVCHAFWLKVCLAIVWASLAPSWASISALIFLFVVDLVCGTWVACKTRTLSSFEMRRGIVKLALYVIFICSIAVAEHNVFHTAIVTQAAVGLLAATEVLSITENLVALGMPIPYAARVLKVITTKTQGWGINVGDDPNAAAAVRDMVDLIEDQIPKLKDPCLQLCMDEFVHHWYMFMRGLNPSMLVGDTLLVSERFVHQCVRIRASITASLDRADISKNDIHTFTINWCDQLFNRFAEQCQTAIKDQGMTEGQKLDAMRDHIVLMCMRLMREAQKCDGLGVTPLTTNLVLPDLTG